MLLHNHGKILRGQASMVDDHPAVHHGVTGLLWCTEDGGIGRILARSGLFHRVKMDRENVGRAPQFQGVAIKRVAEDSTGFVGLVGGLHLGLSGVPDDCGERLHLVVGRELEAVAGAVDGLDETGLAGVGFELGAQVADVDPDGFDVVVGLVAPDLLEDQGGGDGLAVALEQAMEKLELRVREADGGVEPDGLETLGDEGEGAEA